MIKENLSRSPYPQSQIIQFFKLEMSFNFMSRVYFSRQLSNTAPIDAIFLPNPNLVP